MTLLRRRYRVPADWAGLAGICLFSLLLRFPIAAIPLERDEGEYAYIAQRWLQGEIPYRDSFNQKWPGSFVIYAIIERAVGTSPSALHWGAQVYSLGILAVLFLLGRRLSSAAGGLAAAAFGAVMMIDPCVLGNAANTEMFMLLPLTAAMLALCHTVEHDSPGWAAATGALSAGAVLFKQVAFFNLALCFAVIVWLARRRGASAGRFLLGVAGVLLPVFAYFIAHGAWGDFFDGTIGHNLHYERRLPLSSYLGIFRDTAAPIVSSFWPVLLLAAVPLVRLRPRLTARRGRVLGTPVWRSPLLVAAWLASSFAGTASGGYFREHYFIQCIAPLAVLAGLGVAQVPLERLGGALRHAVRAALIVGPVALAVAANAWYYLPGDAAVKSRRIYGTNPFVEAPMVGRFIAEHSDEDDTVFVFGSEPQILYYSGRRSASRYIFLYPLAGPFRQARQRQLAVLEDLAREVPRFIVTVGGSTTFAAAPGAPTDLPDALTDLVERSYRLAAAVRDTGEIAPRLVTGAPARELWRRAPVACCSLAVWERVAPEADAPS